MTPTTPTDIKETNSTIVKNWTIHQTQEGKKYYYNTESRVSVWDKPDELKTEEERIRDSVPWKEHKTSDGKLYFYNPITKETTWECPSELAEALKKIAYLKGQDANSDKAFSEDYGNMDEAKQAFKQLLRDCNVPSNASWETVTKMTCHDKRFCALKQTNEKKKVFNTYKQIKANEEKQQERTRQKQLKERLKGFLENCDFITSYMRYSKIHEMLRDNDVWYSVPDRDRRDILEEVQPSLVRREREVEKERSRCNQRNVLKFLHKYSTYFPFLTKFTDALEIIKNENLLKNHKIIAEIFLNDMEDVLIAYENFITSIEKKFDKKQTIAKHAARKTNRLTRESFNNLLFELYLKKKISKNSQWKQLWSTFKDDHRLHDMLGQTGSTPLDLFKLFIYNLKNTHPVKKLIKSLIKDLKDEFTYDKSFDEFISVVPSDHPLNKIDKILLKIVYQKLQRKSEHRQTYKKKDKEVSSVNKLKRNCKKFYEMLKLLDPPLTSSVKWVDIEPHIINEPEYINLTSDYIREKVFRKFIRRLSNKSSIDKTEKLT